MKKVLKTWKLVLVAFLVLMMSFGSFACDIHGKTGIAPENNRSYPVGLKSEGGINEATFNKIMDKIFKLYSPVVAMRGARFSIDRRWFDPTANAYAEETTPGVYRIHMFGGLARHPQMTSDGMALVACHELGHHIGGAPKKFDENKLPLWASNEGQADYWGSMKCLRNYFSDEDNELAVKDLVVDPIVKQNCEKTFSNLNEQLICIRTAIAGEVLANVLADLGKESAIKFSTPDSSIVKVTFDKHPKAQCRLDTFLQASLCDVSYKDAVSDTDANIGVCSLKNGNSIGNRPLCWFKPE